MDVQEVMLNGDARIHAKGNFKYVHSMKNMMTRGAYMKRNDR